MEGFGFNPLLGPIFHDLFTLSLLPFLILDVSSM